ncbi:DUF11 domain-containing protein [Nocardioides albus]|uniref:Putative repeat protein (TIGR01451 family)/fimbrial isopeptide formation D2 family protein n=1 Tax=Nocardioides albus TaxID=1841 RepID=A0A7W5FBA2_9ACTN|nr:DUF11 domain-containing protein [Nocardioides albus]MBB3092022.1 putative repeat protein (TIGR01451 family)/fimbrial isopeptide formation D2 family protein [Nocardioides albus]GGU43699.1 hypothetical protein GCM10007979_48620 [Nocardioides albus]
MLGLSTVAIPSSISQAAAEDARGAERPEAAASQQDEPSTLAAGPACDYDPLEAGAWTLGNGNAPAGNVAANWVGAGGGASYSNADDTPSGAGSQLQQTVTGVTPGSTLSVNVHWNHGVPNPGDAMQLTLSYAGVNYAAWQTPYSAGSSNVVVANGATITPTTGAAERAATTYQVTLPDSIPRSGLMRFAMTAITDRVTPGDDFRISNLSMSSGGVCLSKNAGPGAGGTYDFTSTNTDPATASIAVEDDAAATYDAEAAESGRQPLVAVAQNTDVTLTEQLPPGIRLADVACEDAATQAPVVTSREGETVTVPAAAVAGSRQVHCEFTNAALQHGLEINKSVEPAGPVSAGDALTYTVTVENTGEVAYSADAPARFTDDMTDVLAAATYNDDGNADVGTVDDSGMPQLSWSGPLDIGATATITYSVTVADDAEVGDTIDNAVTGPPESNCVESTETGCTTQVPVVERPGGPPLACDTVWAVQGGNPHNIYEVDTSNGDLTARAQFEPSAGSGNTNALGISADGVWAYAHNDGAAHGFNSATGETTSVRAEGGNFTHGAVDPSTGVYYYGRLSGDEALVYAYDPASQSALGHVATIDLGSTPGANGDWAFDAQGNLYLTAGGNTSNGLYVTSGPLPTTEQASPAQFDGKRIGTINASDPINGLAVDVLGYIYLASANTLFQVHPSSGQVTNTESLSPGGVSVDLGSCATPSTVKAQKDVEGRIFPSDQFTVSITGGGIPEGAVEGTTTGTDDGIQDESREVAGPIMALAEETYTVTETGVGDTDLGNYVSTWECVNESLEPEDPAYVVASGEGSSGEFTVPSTVGSAGAAVVCTFTNVADPEPGLEITKTSDAAASVAPGDKVTYTVSVENTGTSTYTPDNPATFTDDLSEVIDDATYNDDASADVGEASYAEPELRWEGPLAPGEKATITYSVTVNDPPSGDGTLTNAVVGPEESTCVEGTEEGCTTDVPVRSLDITKTAEPSGSVAAGDTVTYTVTVENTGQADYTAEAPATFTDDLTKVLDDAAYNDDAAADVGEVTYEEPTLSWEGALPAGETATVTYSVTVDDPVEGDGVLTNAVVGPAESDCDEGTEEGCTTDVPVRALEITKTAEPGGEVVPGDTVTYTVTVKNTGQADYTRTNPATFADTLNEVLDDATYNDDLSADTGVAVYNEPMINWFGPLAAGETATITYSVTVNDPLSGDGVLTNAVTGPPESNCVDGTEPECSTDVLVKDLEIAKTVDATDIVPGDTVTYTVTVENTGQAPYTADDPARFTDDLTQVLDDATYNDDAAADIGEVSYAEPELSWSGALAPGDKATITYSVTINDPLSGDGVLTNGVVGPPESDCIEGTEPECSTVVPTPGLDITKSADPSGPVTPGETVTYTVTVENTGKVDYTAENPATFTDDLTAVIDDATYNDDASASVGSATYAEPTLSWSGPLPVGETATITYSVTVDDPPGGDGKLTNAVVGPDESNCDDGTEEGCHIVTPVRALEITKTSDPAAVNAGGTVTYTVTVENTGNVPYTRADPATFTDDLTAVLDDATYNDDAAASTGTVTYAEPELSWSGALAPGETAMITYSVKVADPITGDGTLTNAVVGPEESNCDDGTEDGCHTDVPVRALLITKASEPAEVTPGGTVTYTVTVENTGQVRYTAQNPATFTDDLTAVLDDATYNDDANATAGTATFEAPNLAWSGPLAPGDTATITYSVTVNDPQTGDGELTNAVVGPEESNCDEGTEPECSTDDPVKALKITKTAEPRFTRPGDTVTYTVTVENTGQAAYTEDAPATFDDDMSDVLDDATYNDDASADIGTPTFAAPTLHWEGALEPGETATVTYSVTVNDPQTGDGTLGNSVVGPPESNCDEGTEEDCTIDVPIRELTIVKTADPGDEVVPGDTVTYTVKVTNTGGVPFGPRFPASFTDDLATDVLDDATYNDDASADTGEVTYADGTLSWESELGVDETATITYSVTVNDPPTGDGVLTNAVVGPPVSNCEDSTAPECHTDVPVKALEIVKSAEPDGAVNPGGTTTYTVKVTNTGQVAYTADDPARFDDDLSAVLDDATYNDDAAADVGEVTYSEPTMRWQGALEPGDVATITYSVTVNDPLTGDGTLTNAVVGPPESNCDSEGRTGRAGRASATADDCTTTDPVQAFEVSKTVKPKKAVSPGDTVSYTVEVVNTGQAAYTADDPASFSDDLSAVLDDATYNDDASATAGETSYDAPTLTWSGPLEVGGTVTVTYSVTTADPVSGDGELVNVVTPDGGSGGSCLRGVDANCTTDTPIKGGGNPDPTPEPTPDPTPDPTPGPTPGAGPTLPDTGAPRVGVWALLALLLLASGAGMITLSRRRRRGTEG